MDSHIGNTVFANDTMKLALKYPRDACAFAAFAAILCAILGIMGNLITVVALSRCPKLRMSATTWFVISLSVSDLIFCVFNLPLTATRFIFGAWIFNDWLCKLFPFFFYANFGASLYHIMLIAINRCALIRNYITYKKVYKPRNVFLMILAVWAVSFALLLPPLLGVWGTMGLDETTFSCTILSKDGMSPKKVIFAGGILPPFLVVIVCYSHILYHFMRSKRVLRRIQESTGQPCLPSPSKRDEMRLTKTMILIFACFVTCFIPLMVVNVIEDEISSPWIHILASALAWASAAINPIIYSISSKTYRQAYMDLFQSCWNRHAYTLAATSAAPKTTTSDTAGVGP